MSVIKPDRWQLAELTAREVFGVHAALEVVYDEDDEHYPGVNDVHDSVMRLRNAALSAGYVPAQHPNLAQPLRAFTPRARPKNEGRND